MSNRNNSRREFFTRFLAPAENTQEDSDKIKMLTADGKLVEVDPNFIVQEKKQAKTTNAEILAWTNVPKK